MLYIVCEVCSSFKPISKDIEHYLLVTEAIICGECRCYSPIPIELKNMLRKERGLSEK